MFDVPDKNSHVNTDHHSPALNHFQLSQYFPYNGLTAQNGKQFDAYKDLCLSSIHRYINLRKKTVFLGNNTLLHFQASFRAFAKRRNSHRVLPG